MARRFEGTPLVVDDALYDAIVKSQADLTIARLLTDSYAAKSLVKRDPHGDPDVNYLSANDDGTISYLTKTRAQAAKREGWSANDLLSGRAATRQSASAGKVLRKLLVADAFGDGIVIPYRSDPGRCVEPRPRVADADVEAMAVFLQATFRPLEFKVVTGEAIRYWYLEDNYTRTERSLLHDSCMRYASCWNDIRFYAQNPLVVGMLVVFAADNKLKGRALLWRGPDGVFMDRVYGTEQTQAAFRRFADKQGWFYRKSDKTGYTNANKTSFFAVPLQQVNMHQKPPYFDTFDLVRVHASGDRAEVKNHNNSVVSRGDLSSSFYWMASEAVNPAPYAAVVLRGCEWPSAHPMRKVAGAYDRDPEDRRNKRVDWLSDFSWATPWPEGLVATDPSWTLERWGSEPEDDAANAGVRPERRTEALVIARPEPQATSGIVLDGIDAETFRANVAALDAAFARMARGEPGIPVMRVANGANAGGAVVDFGVGANN